MATKTIVDPIEAARLTVEQAEEMVAELEAQKRSLAVEQQQLGSEDAERFYEIQRQIEPNGEMDTKIHFAKVTMLRAKIAFCDVFGEHAKTEIPLLEQQIAILDRQIAPILAQKVALGNKVNLFREHAKHYRGTRTSYQIALDNLHGEWQQQLVASHAPPVRNLMRRPQAQ